LTDTNRLPTPIQTDMILNNIAMASDTTQCAQRVSTCDKNIISPYYYCWQLAYC